MVETEDKADLTAHLHYDECKMFETNNKSHRKWAPGSYSYLDFLDWIFLALFMVLGFLYPSGYKVVCSPQAWTCLWKNSNSDFMLCLTLKLSLCTINVWVISFHGFEPSIQSSLEKKIIIYFSQKWEVFLGTKKIQNLNVSAPVNVRQQSGHFFLLTGELTFYQCPLEQMRICYATVET